MINEKITEIQRLEELCKKNNIEYKIKNPEVEPKKLEPKK